MKKRTFVLLAAIAACTSAPKTELEVIDKLKILDKPMKKPAMDEWLFEHKEAGQTFADYQKLTPGAITCPNPTRNPMLCVANV